MMVRSFAALIVAESSARSSPGSAIFATNSPRRTSKRSSVFTSAPDPSQRLSVTSPRIPAITARWRGGTAAARSMSRSASGWSRCPMPLSITDRARVFAAPSRRVMRTLNLACNARLQFRQADLVVDRRPEQISLCLEDRLLGVGHVLVGGLAKSKPYLGDLQLALRLLDLHGERLHALELRADLDDGRP